ncbi:hypothetical protein B0T22DRAFT_202414 [Podospora appendiculata]|uniref:Uncharacterized protein n=1 Tax=Podospora appendiculata TaxID=314037 RepID=A0AAE0X4V8_9PEZI|nr:hypothetical protein B0T22DRAFT_202414 [Podospora appendiculata]
MRAMDEMKRGREGVSGSSALAFASFLYFITVCWSLYPGMNEMMLLSHRRSEEGREEGRGEGISSFHRLSSQLFCCSVFGGGGVSRCMRVL